jgi:hypothetical protein
MAGGLIRKYRCPGRVSVVTEKTAHLLDKDRDGCWITIGLRDVNFEKDGRVYCPSCGDSTDQRDDKVPALHSEVHAEFVVDRMAKEVAIKLDPNDFLFGACYNPECSKTYLPADGGDSDARSDDGRIVHGGTQYVMARTPKGVKSIDRWRLEGPRHIIAGKPTPGGIPKPRVGMWFRCLFCGSALRMADNRALAEKITNEDQDQMWSFPGCAVTFRIYRKAEYEAIFSPGIADGNRVPVAVTG